MFIALILALAGSLFAVGETAVPFLTIAPGARSGGMGETGVAHSNNANAIFYNPALLAYQYDLDYKLGTNKFQANLMHTKWLPKFNFNDLYYDYAAARYYIEDFGMVSIGLTYLNLGENQWTDTGGNLIGTFTSNEMALAAGYSFFVDNNLSIGTNLKYIYSNLSSVQVENETGTGQSSGFAIDLGLVWKPEYFEDKFTLGFAVNNIGPAMSYVDKDQADPLPTQMRLGIAYDFIIDDYNTVKVTYETTRLLIYKNGTEADPVLKAMFYSTWFGYTAKESFNKFTHAIGLEYGYNNLFFIRGGYFYEHPDEGDRNFFTMGVGLAIEMLSFDFSYIYTSDENHPLGETLRFSLGLAL
jgi:hypothetical protein